MGCWSVPTNFTSVFITRRIHPFLFCDIQETREEKYPNENGLVSKKTEGRPSFQCDRVTFFDRLSSRGLGSPGHKGLELKEEIKFTQKD